MTITNTNHSPDKLQKPANLSRKPVLTGYWHNWHTEAAPHLPLRDIPSAFDVVNIAFATADPRQPGSLVFEPWGYATPRHFKADVAALQRSGRKVLISVGGATGSLGLEDLAARQNFIASLDAVLNQYEFDGVDVNLEGTIHLVPGDTDLMNPISPSVIHLVEALKLLKKCFGNSFMLSLAPQVACVQGGFSDYDGQQGSYLPVIEHLRDILDLVHVQHYNAEPQKALDSETYHPDDPNFHTAMTEMLLAGFPPANQPNRFFTGLEPNRVSVGLPARKDIVQNGYLPEALLKEFPRQIAGKSNHNRQYKLQNPSGYPGFGNLMTWSINWDAVNKNSFSVSARASLDSLKA
jgi:chitinase